MKKITLITVVVLFGTQGLSAVNKQFKSVNKRSNLNIIVDYKTEYIENLDENIAANTKNRTTNLNRLNVEALYGKKLNKKAKFTSSTKLKSSIGSTKELYKNLNIINDKNIDTEIRELALVQEFSGVYKFNKKVSVNAIGEVKTFKGHSVEEEIESTENNYHIIDESHTKYSLGLGGKVKIIKGHITQGLYKFSEFLYDDVYTYDKKQGSNDRRVHSFGLLHKFRTKGKTIYKASIQYDQIFYKDRLSLDSNGFFQNTGEVDASNIVDQSVKISAKFKEGLTFGLTKVNRLDKVSSGDTNEKNAINLNYIKNMDRFGISIGGEVFKKIYKGQKADDGVAKRVDDTSIVKLMANYNHAKNLKSQLTYQTTQQASNNSFGEFTTNSFSLELKKTF